ncbi:MAG: FHA domain-containing protein [Butyrivibrio sp.]
MKTLYKSFVECIFGDDFGRKYPLHDGINRIGKGYHMDICIADDIQITRDNHCSIIFNEEKGKCVIVPSIGSLTYLNNSLLKESVEIKEDDVFRIGRSEFTVRFYKEE